MRGGSDRGGASAPRGVPEPSPEAHLFRALGAGGSAAAAAVFGCLGAEPVRDFSTDAARARRILYAALRAGHNDRRYTGAPEPLPKSAAPAVITEPTATAEPENGISPETVLRLIRYSGTGLLLLVFAAVYLRGRTEFRMSLPVENDFVEAWRKSCPLRRKVTVRRSDRISAPLTYGVLRPVILLPDPIGEDEKTLGHILTHELVHIRRFDAVKKPLCVLAVCLHWFNPLVWIMFFYFTRDLELACDECAVRELGIGFKSDYAKTLIGMEARKSGLFPFFSHFAGFAAEERIKAIMKLKKDPSPRVSPPLRWSAQRRER